MSDLTLNDIAQALQEIKNILDKEWEDAPTMREIGEQLGLEKTAVRDRMEKFERETGLKIVAKRVSRPTRVIGEYTKVPVYRIIENET
jgi:DNA-binding Lrp family transcriptional regulator